MKKLAICCADIGSVKKGNFGWYGERPRERPREGTDIGEFAEFIAASIRKGLKVSVGFECPLFVPIRQDPMMLTSARNGDGSKSWSANAGCGVLATGLVETVWVLEEVLRGLDRAPKSFMSWKDFQLSESGAYFWEAFVSGKSKGANHSDDARIAVRAFNASLPDLDLANKIKEPTVFSLVGAALVRSGWTNDVSLLSSPCNVIGP